MGARVSINLQTKVIFVFSLLVSKRLKYRIRINLLIVVKQAVLRWYAGEVEGKDIRFHNSSHLSKQVSNSTGWAGKVFIWYGRCL